MLLGSTISETTDNRFGSVGENRMLLCILHL